jgi:hypothetical protein
MRETVRSLRAYLLLVSAYSLFEIGRELLRAPASVALWASAAIDLVFIAGLIYAGLALPSLLRQRSELVVRIVVANAIYQIIQGLFLGLQLGRFYVGAFAFHAILRFLIARYLVANINRLSSEQMAAER